MQSAIFFCLTLFAVISNARPSSVVTNLETINYVHNPSIQKFFTDPREGWEEIEEKIIMTQSRVNNWTDLNLGLSPLQNVLDFTGIEIEDGQCSLNYFALSNDPDIPMYKPSDYNFVIKDASFYDLQFFSFEPPYLNFTESTLFVTSTKAISFSNLSKKHEIKIVSNSTTDAQVSVIHDESFNKIVKSGIKHKIKISYTPTKLKPLKAQVMFTVNVVASKKIVYTRRFVYDVFSGEIQNPFKFTPFSTIQLEVGQDWSSPLSIYNSYDKDFKIVSVNADPELEIRVPWDVNDIIEEREQGSKIVETRDMSIKWNIGPQEKKKFLVVSYTAREIGLYTFKLFVDTEVQNFTIPFYFKVAHASLKFNKEIYDLGVVTDTMIPHETNMIVSNPFSYPIQITNIYASIELNSRFRIFTVEEKIILQPKEESKLIAKLRLLPINSPYQATKWFQGKILILTNDTKEGSDHIQLQYRYAYYTNPLVFLKNDISFYISFDNGKILTDERDTVYFFTDKNLGEMIEIRKIIFATNNYTTALEIKNISSPYGEFEIKRFRPPVKLPLYQRERLFELIYKIPIKSINKTLYNTWILAEAPGMLIPIHINFYDKMLHCSMDIDSRTVIEKCSNLAQISLDFGYVAVNEVRRKTLTLINFNPFNVSIITLNCTLPNCYSDVMKINLEELYDEYGNILEKEINIFRPGTPARPVLKDFNPRYKAVFSFVIDKAIEEYRQGDILIKTSDETIRIPLRYQTLQGSFTFTPHIVRFQPGYPGRKQEASVIIKNQFNTTISIKKLHSENADIIPVLLNPQLPPNEKVEAFKVVFDPSKNKHISFISTVNTSGPYVYGITLEDLRFWSTSRKIWDQLVSNSSTEIKEWIQIGNDVSDKTFLHVKASLTNPILVKGPISFDVIKIGSRGVKEITIENPSDLPIYAQLILGPEEFLNPNFLNEIFDQLGESRYLNQTLLCLIDFMIQNSQDGTPISYDERAPLKYPINHVHTERLNLTNLRSKVDVNETLEEEDILDKYYRRTYICSEGIESIENLILNHSQKLSEKLGREDDKGPFEFIHIQHLKEDPIYEMKAMSYAIPKPIRNRTNAQTLTEKIAKYFATWNLFRKEEELDKFQKEQAKIQEKLRRNVKEIYLNNFNSKVNEQQIFLNSKYKDATIYIAPHSNITIPALIYQPTSAKEYHSALYIKNNLTGIFEVPIKGIGGYGYLIVTDVKKKDEVKQKFTRSPEEFLEGNNKTMKFIIDKSEIGIVDAQNCKDCPQGTKKIRLQRALRRKFTLKNNGNLPIDAKQISIQNLGCKGYGFQIENCSGFKLNPGEEYDLEIGYIPDMGLTYFSCSLFIHTDQEIFEFELFIKMPFKQSQIFNREELLQFTTRPYIKILSYVTISLMIWMVYNMVKDYFIQNIASSKYSWKLTGQEILNYKHPNEIFENIISVKHTFTPMIPPTKMNTSKRVVNKPSERSSKSLLKSNEFKEELSSRLNKFEDSDQENDSKSKPPTDSFEIDKIEVKPSSKRNAQTFTEVTAKNAHKEEMITDQRQIHHPINESQADQKVKESEGKKDSRFEKKPMRQKVIPPKTTTTVIIKKEMPKMKETHPPPRQLNKKNEIQNQPAPKQEQESQQPLPIVEIKEEDYPQLPKEHPAERHLVEEKKGNDSDEEDLLDTDLRNVAETILDKDSFVEDVGYIGHIGSKAKNESENSHPPQKLTNAYQQHIQEGQNSNLSENTSEDEGPRGLYGYFNYHSVFGHQNPEPTREIRQVSSSKSQTNPYFKNDDLFTNTPGLGLFQTKRDSSRYNQYSYFPTLIQEREQETSSRKQPLVNRSPFFTGSEDESGFFSESSVSSKHFNDFRSGDEFQPKKTFNLPNENNPFSFAKLFFPGLDNIAQPAKEESSAINKYFDKAQNIFTKKEDDENEQDESQNTNELNYFFGGGIRYRGLTEADDDQNSSNLPPGLH